MIDHLTLHVSDLDASLAFYRQALAPLGYAVVLDLSRVDIPQLPVARTVGLGVRGKPDLWLRPAEGAVVPTHIAFRAADRATVDAFHQAGLKAGSQDNGRPGVRAHYHPHYYGAFLLDPDGYNVEAVCHDPG
jgi:catechol 2,3-dioxygenase-like lactoylglutathione lyase family enzyme